MHCIGKRAPRYILYSLCAKTTKVHVVSLCYQGYFQSPFDWITKRLTPTILPQNPLPLIPVEKCFCTEAEMQKFEWVQPMSVMQPGQDYAEPDSRKTARHLVA
jgi:hypothetical protein